MRKIIVSLCDLSSEIENLEENESMMIEWRGKKFKVLRQ